MERCENPMQRRNKARPTIKMPFWKQDGKRWFAEKADLLKAIEASGRAEEQLKSKLGAGYAELLEALEGKRLEGWTVSHIEWGLTPESEQKPRQPTHSWPPNRQE
jgi:hypothetical protein